jgi:hypothetical protein
MKENFKSLLFNARIAITNVNLVKIYYLVINVFHLIGVFLYVNAIVAFMKNKICKTLFIYVKNVLLIA